MVVEKNFIVFSTLTTPDPANDSFPIMIDEDMAGGLRTVQHKADMLAIPEERRKVGMEVYVVGDQKKYRYVSETYGPTTTLSMLGQKLKKVPTTPLLLLKLSIIVKSVYQIYCNL